MGATGTRTAGCATLAMRRYPRLGTVSIIVGERASMHGVFIEVMGVGVLLTGAAGVGKSELALELISRGHRLIADDAPEFALIAPSTVSGAIREGAPAATSTSMTCPG